MTGPDRSPRGTTAQGPTDVRQDGPHRRIITRGSLDPGSTLLIQRHVHGLHRRQPRLQAQGDRFQGPRDRLHPVHGPDEGDPGARNPRPGPHRIRAGDQQDHGEGEAHRYRSAIATTRRPAGVRATCTTVLRAVAT